MTEQIYNLAFVFPGQGSQSVGMMSALADSYSEVRQTFEQASDVLARDLWKMVTQGPLEELNQTQNTQPAMLAAGYAVWRVWCRNSAIRPAWVAGHSLGEYTALVCANALSFEDGIRLVAERGRLMQAAVPVGQGAMAAVLGLEDHIVVRVCQDAADGEIVAPVNYNAPGQVVIAGAKTAVERAMALAKEAGAKRVVLLPVSVPSHCALMASAADKLNDFLQNTPLKAPEMILIHNVDTRAHGAPEVICNALKEQLFKPVRWSDSIRFMADQGVIRFVECGPGKVLSGLNKRIATNAEHFSIFDPETLKQTMEAFDD
ncbi:MAG: [acyl-carrier-protein] S-malonyltransferase [Gammaproteobacteria bacterium HGW-Gammaproteobacteria-3]|nr:MAG: [acyl-carrier-protein] S-malonyltransferase [Gammaproteobacteria bacterium HGW-Gammaproteobacteria-3]